MNKKILLIALACCYASASYAENIKFKEVNHKHNVFKTSDESQAYFSYTYDSFKNWQTKLSGQFFKLEPAPVIKGLVEGVSVGPVESLNDASDYEDQAAEFVEHTNFRLDGGRPAFDIKDKNPQELLEKKYNSTHVVEMSLSAVIDIPFEDIDLSQSFANDLAENIDYDHYHFQIPGTLVSNALEKSHIARKKLDENKNYLLSVFDLREYGCDLMKSGVRDYFSKRPKKDRLANGSIYLISDIKFNDPEDIKSTEKYFGKKPDALISQEAMYADHLIRASKMYFAFYKEGSKTRVVFLSNLAMGSKFFTGAKGLLIRQYLLDGVGVTGKAANKIIDGLSSLFADAEEDINKKNSCDSGLALGLKKYSQNLFTEFSSFVKEN